MFFLSFSLSKVLYFHIPAITGFFWRHLHCPFVQHIFSHLSSKPSQLLACFSMSHFLICLLRFLFLYCHITYKVTCLQAVYFLPSLIFLFAPSACLCVTQALHLVKVISNWVDPVTALKIRNLFSYASFFVDHTSRSHEGVPLMS